MLNEARPELGLERTYLLNNQFSAAFVYIARLPEVDAHKASSINLDSSLNRGK
jgi:hypothetical protein